MKTINLIKILSIGSAFAALPILEAEYDPVLVIGNTYCNQQIKWDLNSKEMHSLVESIRVYAKQDNVNLEFPKDLLNQLSPGLLHTIDGDSVYRSLSSQEGLQFIVNFLCNLYPQKEIETALNLFYNIPPWFYEDQLKTLQGLMNLAFIDGHCDIVVALFRWLKPFILARKLPELNKGIFAMDNIQILINIRDLEEVKAWAKCICNLSYRDLRQEISGWERAHVYIDPTPLYKALKNLKEHPNDQTAIQGLINLLHKYTLFGDIHRGISCAIFDKAVDWMLESVYLS